VRPIEEHDDVFHKRVPRERLHQEGVGPGLFGVALSSGELQSLIIIKIGTNLSL
jgi:hypothetical protein